VYYLLALYSVREEGSTPHGGCVYIYYHKQYILYFSNIQIGGHIIDLDKKHKINKVCDNCLLTCKQHILVKVIRCPLRQVRDPEIYPEKALKTLN